MGPRVGAGPPLLRVRVTQEAGNVGMDRDKEGRGTEIQHRSQTLTVLPHQETRTPAVRQLGGAEVYSWSEDRCSERAAKKGLGKT